MNRINGPRAHVLANARALGLRGITSNDAHEYTCHECGFQWAARRRYAWWPMRLRWSWPRWPYVFGWHGAQIGWDGIEQKVFAGFLRVGPVVFCFGWKDEYR